MKISHLPFVQVKNAAELAGFKDTEMAGDILAMMLELKSNRAIIESVAGRNKRYGNGNGLKRKLNLLLQCFIKCNYHDDFREFCRKNGIPPFNDDLDVAREDAVYARFIFIIFLREAAGIRPPIRIVD